jgi:hypothetical protein
MAVEAAHSIANCSKASAISFLDCHMSRIYVLE